MNRQWRHVGLTDFNIEIAAQRQPLCPQQDIRICNRKPKMILRQFQQDRVVDHPPLLIHQWHIQTLTGLGLCQITRGHPLHKLCGIWPLYFHLPLSGHVPDLYVLTQVPVILFGAMFESLGQDRVVDYRKTGNPKRLDPRGIGRGPLAPDAMAGYGSSSP